MKADYTVHTTLKQEKKYLKEHGIKEGSIVELIFPKGYYQVEKIEIVPLYASPKDTPYVDQEFAKKVYDANKEMQTHFLHYVRILSKDGFAHNTKVKQNFSAGTPFRIDKDALLALLKKHDEAITKINSILLEIDACER